MAEIGIVASILGVASVGTKVATSLYEAAHVMYHAHHEIASMASHVSRLTAVLRHLATVLKTEKAHCSSDLLRDIRLIKRSCRATFKEIKATIRARRFRALEPFRWLFKKAKAKELESRLESEQSLLQTMMQTLTTEQTKETAREDSNGIAGLQNEVALLKSLIIEDRHNMTNLQCAEQRVEVEEYQEPLPSISGYHGSQPLLRPFPPIPTYDMDIPYGDPPGAAPRERPASPPSSSRSSTDHEDGDDIEAAEDATRAHKTSHSASAYLDNNAITTKHMPGNSTVHSKNTPTSALLLQMIPYQPPKSNSPRFLPAGPGEAPSVDVNPESTMAEATHSVRLLLDKWTTPGSAPISDILDEEIAKDTLNRHARLDRQTRSPRPRQYMNDSDDDLHNPYQGFSGSRYPYPPKPHVPPPGFHGRHGAPPGTYVPVPGIPPPPPSPYVPVSGVPQPPPRPPFMTTAMPQSGAGLTDIEQILGHTMRAWKSADPLTGAQTRYTGYQILNALRSASGGIVYMKGNEFRQSYFVDKIEVYAFDLVPRSFIPASEREPQFTEIGNGWVRREALNLLSYTYTETSYGHYSIARDLDFSEIEELVRFSFQALSRQMEERSKKLVEERGWRERVSSWDFNASPRIENYPGVPPNFTAASAPPGHHFRDWDPPPPPAPRSPSDLWDELHGSDKADNETLSAFSRKSDLEDQANDPKRKEEDSKVKAEVRFTLPRRSTNPIPPLPDYEEFATKTVKSTIQAAVVKLEALQKKLKEAEEAKDINNASDLKYYAIPEMEQRIKNMRHHQEKEEEADLPDSQSELRVALDKIEILKKKKEEAEKAKNYANASDLAYYAIPEMEERIAGLKRDKEKNGKADSAKNSQQAPRTEIETDSESSDGSS